MNLEVCEKCPNYPDWYELVEQDKVYLFFMGYKKNKEFEKSVVQTNCLVKLFRSGTDYSYMITKFKPESLLNKPRIRLMKEICPCYAEHQLNEWNNEK